MNHNFKKTIKIFLMDGKPTGRMSAELSNWTGKAYKIPRNLLKLCIDRPELNTTGVYFLFGTDDNENNVVYIGESEEVINRLNKHLSEKEFWTEAVIFISKDDNLNKAHIKYLEHHFYKIASKLNRYKIENSNTPTLPEVSESDQSEMEEFMVNSRLLISSLGHKLFDEIINEEKLGSNEEDIFHIRAARGADAKMIQTTEGIVVRQGSYFANPVTESFPVNLNKVRNILIQQGKLINHEDKLMLTGDHIFSSASTAAGIVMGRSANGLTEWRAKDGIRLGEIEEMNHRL